MANGKERGELALIEHIRRRADGKLRAGITLGIGDDCAILRPPTGYDVVVTTDFCLEGRHFRRETHSAESIGHRTLARGLSDLAAMGARPLAAFLSLALPKAVALDARWLDGFLDGMLRLATEHNVPLAGGDTCEAPGSAVLADIVLVGTVKRGKALRREGAHAGDDLYVTNALGGAHAELTRLLEGAASASIRQRARVGPHGSPHYFPVPRVGAGMALSRLGLATAAIDVSDGLSTDLNHLCAASGVAAEVDAAALPIHAEALRMWRETDERLKAALHGGEDYELLFTARPTTRVPRRIAGGTITRIGRMVAYRKGQARVMLVQGTGARTALTPGGWQHLR